MRASRTCASVVLACALAALTACSGGTSDQAASAGAPARVASADAVFTVGGAGAVIYKPDLVPAGAAAKVTSESGSGKTTVTLTLTGLLPNRHYGAHAHTKACGPAAADAGPHFQNQKDPVSPSVDPAFANPQNEIWLDATTDAQGTATSTSTVNWEFTDAAHPASVVVHANHTATEPGKAGTAGDRLACIDVNF